MTFLNRYHSGEHREVWTELVNAGAAIWEKPLAQDAMDVAMATMERIHRNLERLHSRLVRLGYEFAYPDAAFVTAKADAADRIAALEEQHGRLPVSGRAWFRTFETVTFEQSEAQFKGAHGPAPLHGLGSHPALIVRSIENGIHIWNDHLDKLRADGEEPDYDNTLLLVGPVLSNCDTAHFELGIYHMDDLEFGSDGRDDPSFIDHLRDTIEHGGFPFWHYCPKSLPWEKKPDYVELRSMLTDGLEAF